MIMFLFFSFIFFSNYFLFPNSRLFPGSSTDMPWESQFSQRLHKQEACEFSKETLFLWAPPLSFADSRDLGPNLNKQLWSNWTKPLHFQTAYLPFIFQNKANSLTWNETFCSLYWLSKRPVQSNAFLVGKKESRTRSRYKESHFTAGKLLGNPYFFPPMGRGSGKPSRGAVRKRHLPPSWCCTDPGMSKAVSPEGDVYSCWWQGRDLLSAWHPLWAAQGHAIPSSCFLAQLGFLSLSKGWISMLSPLAGAIRHSEMSPIPPKPAQTPLWGLRAVIFIPRWKLSLSGGLERVGVLENNCLFEE